VPTTEEEIHHEEATLSAAVIATSTIHFDGGKCESEQMSQVVRSPIKDPTCRQEPYVKQQGLGKEYSSSDPPPYGHPAGMEATRVAARAATAASTALVNLREMPQGQAHALHQAAMAACDVTTAMEHTHHRPLSTQ
jgi:hypothetical protein